MQLAWNNHSRSVDELAGMIQIADQSAALCCTKGGRMTSISSALQILSANYSNRLGTFGGSILHTIPTSATERTAAIDMLSAADTMLGEAARDARAIHPKDGFIPLPSTRGRSSQHAESAVLRLESAQDLMRRSTVFPEQHLAASPLEAYVNNVMWDTSMASKLITGELGDPHLTKGAITRAAANLIETTRSTVQNVRRQIIDENLITAADRQAVAAVKELQAEGIWNIAASHDAKDATRLLMHEQISGALGMKGAAKSSSVPTAGLGGDASITQFRAKVAHQSLTSAIEELNKLKSGPWSVRSADSRFAAGERALMHARMARHQITQMDGRAKPASIRIVDNLIEWTESTMHGVRTGEQSPKIANALLRTSHSLDEARSLSTRLGASNQAAINAAVVDRAGDLSSRALAELRSDSGSTTRDPTMRQITSDLADNMFR